MGKSEIMASALLLVKLKANKQYVPSRMVKSQLTLFKHVTTAGKTRHYFGLFVDVPNWPKFLVQLPTWALRCLIELAEIDKGKKFSVHVPKNYGGRFKITNKTLEIAPKQLKNFIAFRRRKGYVF